MVDFFIENPLYMPRKPRRLGIFDVPIPVAPNFEQLEEAEVITVAITSLNSSINSRLSD